MKLKTVLLAAASLAFVASTQAFADIKFGVAAEPYAPFTSKDASGKWVVAEVAFGGGPGVDLAALWPSVNSQKAERARADLSAVRDALEAYRRARGFYVVAEDSVILMDYLSPRYIKQIIRLDPWHNPYRYAGTTGQFTLASDGPDGKPNTADDVIISR